MRTVQRSAVAGSVLVGVATWMALTAASAHAYLVAVEPSDDGVVTTATDELTLRFSMGVEAHFSTFEVHRLDVPSEGLPAVAHAPTERERQRLNAQAAQLATRVLSGERDADAPGRIDIGPPTLGEGDTVVSVGLPEGLPNGVYVVVWEVLAFDAHWTSGHQLLFVAMPDD